MVFGGGSFCGWVAVWFWLFVAVLVLLVVVVGLLVWVCWVVVGLVDCGVVGLGFWVCG